MSFLKTVAVSAVIMSAAGMSHAATVDFNNFNVPATGVNNIADDGNIDFGGGIVASVGFTEGVGAVIFDTTPGSVSAGNDSDLFGNVAGADGSNNFVNASDANDLRDFGNVLIVQEDQTNERRPTTGPDDRGAGGSLSFDFMGLISLDEVFLLDSFTGTTASLFDGDQLVLSFTLGDGNNGTILESDTGNANSANEFSLIDFGGAVGDSFVVEFVRSGGIGEFTATTVAPVPVPASLPLLVGGFGVMAFMRRRRKAA